MDSEYIYNQLTNAFTYASKDRVIADHIAKIYKQLEQLKNQHTTKPEPEQKLESIDLDFNVEYFRYDPEGWILKREGRGLTYRWYSYRDDLLGEQYTKWWWTEVYDSDKLKHYEDLYQWAR